jgi:hypothetical protein
MSSTLGALQQRKERLDEELKQVEKQVTAQARHVCLLGTLLLRHSVRYFHSAKPFQTFKNTCLNPKP